MLHIVGSSMVIVGAPMLALFASMVEKGIAAVEWVGGFIVGGSNCSCLARTKSLCGGSGGSCGGDNGRAGSCLGVSGLQYLEGNGSC